MDRMLNHPIPQVKICGLTKIQDALTCADLGADAAGFVFYPPSPRHIDRDNAKKLCGLLPPAIGRVGVFVNHSFADIMPVVEECGLTAVQLHGRETPELVTRLRNEGIGVIKALFLESTPGLEYAGEYPASAFLIEYGKGKLPGGNARTWDWQRVRSFGHTHPFILAGGLTPFNVAGAIKACAPDAVDVSSGVEKRSGQKDFSEIKAFLHAVRGKSRTHREMERKPRRIFNAVH